MGLLDDINRNRDPRLDENVILPVPPPPSPEPPVELLQPSPLGQQPVNLDQPLVLPEVTPEGNQLPSELSTDIALPTDSSFPVVPDNVSPALPAPMPGLDSSVSVLGGGVEKDRFGEVALPAYPESSGFPEDETGEPDYQIPEGLGQQKPQQLQVLEQKAAEQAQAQANQPYEIQALSGQFFNAPYEAVENYKQQMAEESNAWYNARRQSIHQAERSLRSQTMNPSIPGKPEVGSGNFDIDPIQNPLKTPDDKANAGNWLSEGVHQLGRFGQALGFRGDGKTFDPWHGGKVWLEKVKEDPKHLLAAPFLPFIVGATGKYGEYGEGYAGSLLYILNLVPSAAIGGATDIYNVVNGKYKPNQAPNVVQSLLGKAYDFTQERSDEKPLSVIGKNTTPKTWTELEQRSIIYGLNPGTKLAFAALRKAYGEKIPDWIVKAYTHPDGGTWLRVPEVIAGLAADIATPDYGDIKRLFNPKFWSNLGKKAPTQAGEAAEIAGKIKPDRPQNIQPPSRAAAPDVEVPKTPQQPQQPKVRPAPQAIQQYPFPVKPGSPQAEALAKLQLGSPALKPTPKPSQVVGMLAKKGGVIDPTSVVSVVRSNEDLTKLAIANGDLTRFATLNKKRLDALAQSDPLYSRIGAPIPDEVKQAIELSNPTKYPDMTTQEAWQELQRLSTEMSRTSDPDELFRLSQQGDEVASILTDTPDVVNNPNRLTEVQSTLPEEQIAQSPAAVELTQNMLRAETAYTEAAETAAELQREVVEIQTELANYLDNMDDLAPNVGRKPLEGELPYEPKPVPVEDDVPVPFGQSDTPDLYNLPKLADEETIKAVDEIELFGKELDNALRTVAPDITDAELDSIVRYIYDEGGYSSFEINAALRKGETPRVDPGVLDSAISKMPIYDGKVIRGQHRNPNLSVGDVFEDPGYMSTSMIDKQNQLFKSHAVQFVINSKNGRNIQNTLESEVLFPRNSRFKVTAVKKDGYRTIYEMDELADTPEVKEKLTEFFAGLSSKTDDILSVPQTVFHGSKVRNLDLAKADPIVGGSRGEFGTAIYFTRNMDDAVDYAKATPSRNLPNLPGREFDEVGTVYEIGLSVRRGLFAGDTNVPSEVRKSFIDGLTSSPFIEKTIERGFTRWIEKNAGKVSLSDMYNKVDELILKKYGTYSEEAGLDAMRRINDNIRNAGYDAIIDYSGGQSRAVIAYLGKPGRNTLSVNSATKHGTGDLLEQATHRYNADQKSLERLPKSLQARANAVDSTANLIYRIGDRTEDAFRGAVDEADRLARELIDNQRKLEKAAEVEQATRRASKMQEAKRADAETIRHNNKVDDNPCL